ncbi:hypothetical protein MKW92_012554 [Papaver armeniacum]|nr:hypothetical protein MKW92_012554 [Papaver armeniacum]
MESRRRHVVAMPYPGRGHINPMMNFCKLLTARFSVKDDIRITFVVTEEWLGILESESRLPPQIHLHSIPNMIPSELGRGSDHKGFFEAVQTKMEDPFEQVLDHLQQEDDFGAVVTAIIADTLLPWAVSVGNRKNIPVTSFWTTSPSLFSIVYHMDLLSQNGHYPADFSSGRADELIDYIPGVSPIRLSDMPASLNRANEQAFKAVFEAVSAVRKAHCLLLTTYHELEPLAIKALMEALPVPVYPVGPSIPLSTMLGNDHDRTMSIGKMDKEEYYLQWLDSQPENSVLYVSFGSFLSASSEQMEEILAGLRESDVRYLLVSRGGKDRLNDNSRSLVVPWCDQLRVLCHPSVGGFWTHCGWNSILEGIYAGVPMLTFPVAMDQLTNNKLITDHWKIGIKIMKGVGAERPVTREEVALTVKKLMHRDDEESKAMMTRANEFKKSCRQALAKGGSSTTNLDGFIRNILQYHYN